MVRETNPISGGQWFNGQYIRDTNASGSGGHLGPRDLAHNRQAGASCRLLCRVGGSG